MIDPVDTDAGLTRPLEMDPAAALPLNARDGATTISLTDTAAHRAQIVEGSIARAIFRLAAPAVASMLLMTVFFTADAYWVGTRIGPQGMAAVSTSVFWVWMFISVAELVSVGLTAVAARRFGERNHQLAVSAIWSAMWLALALGVGIAILGLLELDRMLALMNAPADVAALGKSYLSVYLVGAPLIFGFFAIDAAFRASGDTRTPFALLLVSVAAAVVLDPILILGIGPAPKLGIAGAAVATIVTRGTAFVAGLVMLARRGMIKPQPISWQQVRAIVRVGLPTAATGVLFSVIYVLLTRITTRFGTPALAAIGVGHRVESWWYMVGVGLAGAAAAIVGQNLGAREVGRAERAGWIAMGYASAIGVMGCVFEFIFALPLASVFTNDAATAAEGARYLRVAAASALFVGAEVVGEGALGGAGWTLPPMLTSTAFTALRIPLAAWAAPRYGTTGIWATISITAIARGIAMALLWRSGGWKRKTV
ncbi:MAG: MATE family efflux transporter [Gemmatimonadota bacterium]|nr:MATE family efflux transporter [Gemmatimonadota bacterium]